MNEILLKNGILVGLEPLKLERLDLLIVDGRVAARGENLSAGRDARVIDCRGRYVLPGFVNAHSQLYASQTLGMPRPDPAPASYRERLEGHWWRLDHALTPETTVTAAFAGALDAVRLGTTTVIDLHSSPEHVAGSLDLLRDTVLTIGLRGVFSYEVSDRDGPEVRDAAIEENRRFARENRSDKSAGLVGAHASFTLSDESLQRVAEFSRDGGGGLHIGIDEDALDAEDGQAKHGMTPARRLDAHGLLGPKSVLTHAVHTSDEDLALIRERGAWIVHCPTANARNLLGAAPMEKLGDFVALGTGDGPSDMFAEARAVYLQARARGVSPTPEDVIKMIVGGQQLASELLGLELGSTRRDAGADFVFLRYHPRTPIDADNLASHILFGMSAADIEAVMIDGEVVFRNGTYPSIDTRRLSPLMKRGAEELWQAMSPAVATEEA